MTLFNTERRLLLGNMSVHDRVYQKKGAHALDCSRTLNISHTEIILSQLERPGI